VTKTGKRNKARVAVRAGTLALLAIMTVVASIYKPIAPAPSVALRGGPSVTSSANAVGDINTDGRDFPDPFVLKSGAAYFAFGTNTGAVNVQVMSSTDLVHWQTL
jgi:hypothetical protein